MDDVGLRQSGIIVIDIGDFAWENALWHTPLEHPLGARLWENVLLGKGFIFETASGAR
jgi:hypothetical protein